MKTALYQFFSDNFGFEKYDPKVQKIVLGKENNQTFLNAINVAKEQYKREIVEKVSEKREIQETQKWEVPMVVNYNSRYKAEEQPISAIKPFYMAKLSEPERLFIDTLNKSSKVKWWYKNGESEIKYFAVVRKDNLAFYPDFIVQFKDGKIGIFDTKSGRTAETSDAKPRAEALYDYLKTDKRLWGGIVIDVNGTWRYNDNKEYDYNPNDLSDWKILEL